MISVVPNENAMKRCEILEGTEIIAHTQGVARIYHKENGSHADSSDQGNASVSFACLNGMVFIFLCQSILITEGLSGAYSGNNLLG
jgi:hypothetical protein